MKFALKRANKALKNASATQKASSLELSPIDVRPNFGNLPTLVEFAMLAKNFYGADVKKSTVAMDIVLTLQWVDNRTRALVPPGLKELTLSQARAERLMWMPFVAVTNRDLEGSQVTSTGVTVDSQGVVQKIQRMLVVAKNSFDIRAFPFDMQTFKFRIASTTFMADELQLKEMEGEGISGVKEGIFTGQEYDFVSASQRVFEDQDGALVKSRGELNIEVKRNSDAYVKNLLVPELLLVAIAYTVFLFPQAAPFIMPRVATSMMSFMALMVLSLRTSAMLPTRGSSSWIDVFEESCMMMMFTTLCLNVLVEVLEHECKLNPVASAMQKELRVGLPIVEIIVICICFFRTDGTGLWWSEVSTKIAFFGVLVPYLGWCVKRIVTARQEKKEEQAAAK